MNYFGPSLSLVAALTCVAPAVADELAVAPTRVEATVADARLADLRGRYVPSDNTALAGNIVYFGLDMKSLWTTGTGPTVATYAADLHVGFDFSKPGSPVIDIFKTSSESTMKNPGAGAHSDPGAIAGAPTIGDAGGLVQAIQIAGNGNTVTNGASISVSTVVPSLTVAPASAGTTCSTCSFSTDDSNFGVTIKLPDGSNASQLLTPNGISQSVRVTSDFNTIANQLKLALGVGPGAAPGGASAVNAFVAPLPTVGFH